MAGGARRGRGAALRPRELDEADDRGRDRAGGDRPQATPLGALVPELAIDGERDGDAGAAASRIAPASRRTSRSSRRSSTGGGWTHARRCGSRPTRGETTRAARSRPEGFPAVYSDLGYLLAGEALARAIGARDAGEAIGELVLEPLGLGAEMGTARELEARGIDLARDAAPTEDVAWRGGVVRGRVHDENAWALTGAGGSGHAGIFGTVGAVLAFGCAVLDALESKSAPLSVGSEIGWLVAQRPGGTLRAGFDGKSAEGSSAGTLAGARTFGHLGFTGTSLWIDPEARASSSPPHEPRLPDARAPRHPRRPPRAPTTPSSRVRAASRATPRERTNVSTVTVTQPHLYRAPGVSRWRFVRAYTTTFAVIFSYVAALLQGADLRQGLSRCADRGRPPPQLPPRLRDDPRLQGLFIKVGQLLSIMANFLPEAFREPARGPPGPGAAAPVRGDRGAHRGGLRQTGRFPLRRARAYADGERVARTGARSATEGRAPRSGEGSAPRHRPDRAPRSEDDPPDHGHRSVVRADRGARLLLPPDPRASPPGARLQARGRQHRADRKELRERPARRLPRPGARAVHQARPHRDVRRGDRRSPTFMPWTRRGSTRRTSLSASSGRTAR